MPGPQELYALADLITPMALRVAATLRIADALGDEPRPIGPLAAEVGADPGALARVLRHLAARGVFAEPEPGSFAMTPLAESLRDDAQPSLRGWLDLGGFGGQMDLSFVDLLTAVRDGHPPDQTGREDLDDATGVSYDEMMEAQSVAQAPAIVAAHDFAGARSVVDVGGGTGTLLAAVLDAHPDMTGVLLELPETAARAKANLDALGDRARILPASILDVDPPPADRYLLKFLLHAFDDAPAAEIVQRCARAANPGARILIVEQTVTGPDDDLTGFTSMDMRMFILGRGRERTLAEYEALGARAGLTLAGATRAGGPHVIELVA